MVNSGGCHFPLPGGNIRQYKEYKKNKEMKKKHKKFWCKNILCPLSFSGYQISSPVVLLVVKKSLSREFVVEDLTPRDFCCKSMRCSVIYRPKEPVNIYGSMRLSGLDLLTDLTDLLFLLQIKLLYFTK